MALTKLELEATVNRLHREIDALKAERGTYVLALERIRSAPSASWSSKERYLRCVNIADSALNAHTEARR